MTYWDKIISMALRYGAVFVSGYMASESVPTFNLLRTNPLPMELEQRKAICASKALACVLPILTAIYGLPSAITIMNVGRTKHGYLFTIFAVLDLTLFACFLASLFLGSSDIYLKPGFCDDNVRDGRLPIGPASFLFQVIGDMKGCDERKCYVETCRNLEVISYMTATLCALTGLMSVATLRRVPIPWPVVMIYGHISLFVKALFDSYVSLVRRLRQCKIDRHELDWTPDKKPKLHHLFTFNNPNPTIIALSSSLHYSDLINLSLASRSLFHSLFHSSSQSNRHELLRTTSCSLSKKSQCWSCGSQICSDCLTEKSVSSNNSDVHYSSCKPYCSQCYYRSFCRRWVSGSAQPDKYSTHIYSHGRESPAKAIAKTSGYQPCKYIYEKTIKVKVCRYCDGLTEKDVLALRDGREKSEVEHLVRQGMSCAECSLGLGKKISVWWGCKSCGRECRADVHPVSEYKR